MRPTPVRRSSVLRVGLPSKCLVVACLLLAGAAVEAAGKSDMTAEAPGMPSAERAERLREMRRQLLEYQRSWRGAATEQPSSLSSGTRVPSLRDLPAVDAGATVAASPASTLPLDALPLGVIPLDATRLGAPSPAALPLVGPVGTTPIATPAMVPSVSDSRLSDRERNLLRQQLRQLPRPGPSPRN